MSNNPSNGPERPEVERARRVDAACRRFEEAWRAGHRVCIENQLGEMTGAEREMLLIELVALERELRAAHGERPTASEYRERFPGIARQIAAVFAESSPPPGPPANERVAEAPTLRPPSPLELAPTEMGTLPARAHGTPAEPGTLLPTSPPGDVPTVDLRATALLATQPTVVRYFGDYELLRELARGGMGVVYQARQVNLNRMVALKMILAGQLASEADVKRFYLEAEAAANLDHPGIVPIFEVGQHENQHYFSMGFVEGQSLAERVAAGPLPPREAAALVRTIAEAVQYAHDKGVIHRDLKPANVLLDAKGQPRVTDFGLAKKLKGDSGLTASGQVMGTPSYMPPEQAVGQADVGPLADVYSLGAVLYHLLTGRPPFQAASVMDTLLQVMERDPVSPRQLDPGITRDIETIALKCLEKDPARRYASAGALADDLRRFLDGQPIAARPASRAEKAWKWTRRNPVVASLCAVTVLAILGGTAGVCWQWRRAEAALTVARRNFLDAQAQRKVAEANYDEAKAQRKLAEEKTAAVQTQAKKLERQAYVSLVAVSQQETEANNVALADRHLDRCPEPLRGWEWRYCSRTNHDERAVVRTAGRDYTLLSVLSPDGSAFACVGGKAAWVRDLEGKEQFAMVGHTDEIQSVAWSPDGTLIATGGKDREIRLWSARDGAPRGVLRGHRIWVMGLCFSPDNRRLASAAGAWALTPGRAHEVKLWDVGEAREPRTLLSGSGGGALSVAFSPDGRLVAAGTIGGGVHVWEAGSGRPVHEFGPSPHQGTIFGVTFSPDGRLLAAATEAGSVIVWNVDSRAEVRTFRGHDGEVKVIRFTRDGHRLASGSKDTTVRLWSLETGGQQGVLHGHTGSVSTVDFDPSGERLYSSSLDGTTRVWDATWETHPAVVTGHTGWVNTVAFHPDNTTMATGGWGGIHIWNAATGRRLGRIGTTDAGGPLDLAYSPNGKQLASVGGPIAQIWDVPAGRPVHAFNSGARGCGAVAFSPDGADLIVGSDDGDVHIWNLATGAEKTRFHAHDEPIRGISVARGGQRLATSTQGETVKVWDLGTGRAVTTVSSVKSFGPPRGAVAVFDPTGERLAVLRQDNAVAVIDAREGRLLQTLSGHSAEVRTLAFSPDGRRLASGGSDQMVRVWDPQRGDEMLTMRGRAGEVARVAWSGDGRFLAAVGVAGGRIWDAGAPPGPAPVEEPDPEAVVQYQEFTAAGDGKPLERVAFAPDGKTLALASASGDVRLWDTATSSVRAVLRGHTAPAVALAFSPDGALLATGAGDWQKARDPGEIKLWDAHTAALLADLKGHAGAVWALAFAPDGRTLASGSSDGLVKLWDCQRRAERSTLDSRKGQWVRGLAFTPDGKTLAASQMETVRLWDVAAETAIADMKGHSEEINALAISPDGTMMATASRDQTAVIWEIASQRKLATPAKGKAWMTGVAFAPDNKSLVYCALDGLVNLWDVAGNRIRATGLSPGGSATCVAFSPDGKTIASGQADLVLWRFRD